MKMSVPKGESPVGAGVVTRSQASGKLVYREVWSEVSGTTKSGTDEQERHTEASQSG